MGYFMMNYVYYMEGVIHKGSYKLNPEDVWKNYNPKWSHDAWKRPKARPQIFLWDKIDDGSTFKILFILWRLRSLQRVKEGHLWRKIRD